MGGGQGKPADSGANPMDACDHTRAAGAATPPPSPPPQKTARGAPNRAPPPPHPQIRRPIFSCYDDLPPEEAIAAKEFVAASFRRVLVPDGKSIFAYKVGRRDLLIVEKGCLSMVSCHGEKNKKDRPLIKEIVQGEMMGMMELVRNVEQDLDAATGEFPTDVSASGGKAALLVLAQEVYQSDFLGTGGQTAAARLFCDNLERLTRESVVDWLRKVVVLSELDAGCLEKFAAVAHFRSEFPATSVVVQDAKLDRLHVVLSGSLRVHCHDAKGQECTVGHLQSGDFFGESALLKRDDKDHGFLPLGSTASVTTESECLFIYFEASKMRECLESMPQIAARIDRYIKDRITAQLLAMNLTLFEAMRPAAVALFTSVLEIHTYTRGDAIIVEGECNEFFYVLVSGAVAVDAGEGAKAVHVDLTAKGDYFGEMSLLRHEAAHASVKAAADTTLACIPGESFAALCLSSPEMAAEFEIKALGTKASVGALLCHPRTAPLLKAFLDAEFSSENYHAWDLVEQFRATAYAGGGGDPAKLQADAQAIYGRYFANDAEELINMSAKATRALKKHFDAPPPDGPPSDLFEPAQKCISNNLRGNLQRFCVTPDYKTLLDDFGIYKKAGKK